MFHIVKRKGEILKKTFNFHGCGTVSKEEMNVIYNDGNILVLSDFRFLIRILDDKQIDCSVRVFLISV